MNKRKLHHAWVKLRPVKQRYLGIAFIVFCLISVFALRNNNLEMVKLREAVVVADEKGDGVEEALYNLRSHVYGHMNTDLTSGSSGIHPPVQLTNTYERLAGAERERVAAMNKKIADIAVTICEQRFPAGELRNGRVQCVQEYVTTNSVKEKVIPKELYQFDFVSPKWSADLAGFSLVISVVFLVLFVFRYGLEKWVRRNL